MIKKENGKKIRKDKSFFPVDKKDLSSVKPV